MEGGGGGGINNNDDDDDDIRSLTANQKASSPFVVCLFKMKKSTFFLHSVSTQNALLQQIELYNVSKKYKDTIMASTGHHITTHAHG
jgi:hypothetical protein